MDNPLNAGLWINGTYELVDPERFAMIVRDSLGDDAAGYVKDLAAGAGKDNSAGGASVRCGDKLFPRLLGNIPHGGGSLFKFFTKLAALIFKVLLGSHFSF